MLDPDNKAILGQADDVIFEKEVVSIIDGKEIRSFTDVRLKFPDEHIVEIETKAGLQFFETLSESSNFCAQSYNSLTNVSRIEDYKVFLNEAKVADLDNPAVLKFYKSRVVNVWNKWKGGELLKNENVLEIFENFRLKNNSDVIEIIDEDDLYNFLINNNDWFINIFKNNL